MELTTTQKQRLINNIDDAINQINSKRKSEYKVIDILKKKVWFLTNFIIGPIFGFLILIGAVAFFLYEQSQPGVEFVNKALDKYTDNQIYCIVFMVIACVGFASTPIEYFMKKNKVEKLATSLNDVIKNNEAFKFYGKVDNKVKKIYDVTSVDLTHQLTKPNFWIELDKDLSQAVEALEQLKNQLILNSDVFIEQISSKTGEDALITFSDTI
ncbi:hypothetical protein ACNQ1T_02795 [Mycoplasma sp. 1932B]|uniref:hypothetical protein n=1 Tax=Mycoplasma sp. 1932B TaxID=3401670 RepID=UPI003AB002A4